MAVNSGEESQDAHSISMLPDKSKTNMQCEPQLALLSLVEVPNPFKSEMCLDAQLNQNYIDLRMKNPDAHLPCIVKIDIEKGNLETPMTKEETVEKLKSEGPLMISLHTGEKFTQILMNYSLMLTKLPFKDRAMIERVHDTPSNKSRKYKRSNSFNSRKVVLLFSVLSIIGTMILIYLTLRVRQNGGGSVSV
ncbi:uncharacterized protein LOC132286121 isoform X2 [Cornus florida]|uniref:uncharacterized protein LOC132286121 isoform X2 n=1 Tax=Cornus florida TaxID=4283 RepID=UPI00289E4959|nr:uncharacterized protein LOC132286121 isoform X2 [Cornus florida]